MHLHCSGYLWTYSLWTANICQMSVTLDSCVCDTVSQTHWICVTLQNNIICKCYQYVINNVITRGTVRNYLLSCDIYSNKNIHLSKSTRFTFNIDSFKLFKVENAGNFSV